jgi:hypothetical protein
MLATHSSLNNVEVSIDHTHEFTYVVQFNNGRYGVGTSNNPARTIASINSGKHELIKEKLSVNRVVGIKPQTSECNLITTVASLSKIAGDHNVMAL